MSNRKPSKVQIYINSFAAVAFAACAVMYFVIGRPVIGWLYIGCSLLWAACIWLAILTYRNRMASYEIQQQIERRWQVTK